jgi:SAM-dependent methyltransferase
VSDGLRPWDSTFSRWIATGEAEGVDPNDVGDREWNDPSDYVERHLLPFVAPGSVVLELGSGTGRITRHVIGHAGELIAVDYSELACSWLREYLPGRGRFQVHHIDRPTLTGVADHSVDFAFAFGVIEHVGLDDLFWFLDEFARVLAPGGHVRINFDNLMSAGGEEWLRRWRGRPGDVHPFRFYHPEAVVRLGELAGLALVELQTDETRIADALFRAPPA